MQKFSFIIIFIVAIVLAFGGEEFPVLIKVSSRKQLKEVQKIVNYIEDFSPETGNVKAYVNSDSYAKLALLGYNPVELVDTSARNAEYAINHPEDVMYHNYSELSSWVHNLATSYPSIVKIDSLGPTVEGRWIWAVCITDNPDLDEYEPEFVYISTIHGDEPVGTELLIWLCDSLTQKYGADTQITAIVDSLELWIIPMMNPDGNAHGTRYNANSVDLNRNFPVPDGVQGNDGTYTTQPETDAMMQFLSQHQQTMTVNFHTGAVLVNYPWDFDTIRAPDDSLLINRSIAYSSLNPLMYSGYFPQGITNGFDWYEVDGSMQDWDYHQGNGPHLTIELNDVKWPDDSYLPGIWDDNYASMMHLLKLALTGIHGIVVDSLTDEPVQAQIWFDDVGRWVNNQLPVGDFHHQMLAGTHSITVIADGYYPERISDISLSTDSSSVWLTIRLVPADTIFFSNFETDDGGLNTVSFDFYQDWEWGIPAMIAPDIFDSIPGGEKLWCTKLSGNYSDSSQSRLVLDVDLTEKEHAALIFDEWYRFQSINWAYSPAVAHDGGRIFVATETDTTQIKPPWGYICAASEYNWQIPEGDSIFADDEPGTPWHKALFQLDDFCGQNISIIWDFGASNRNTQLGWYIDNIAVVSPGSSLGVACNIDRAMKISLITSPNPFNSKCRIKVTAADYELPIILCITDISGRIFKKFAITMTDYEFVWDAYEIPAGVYLISAEDKYGKVDRRKTILVK
ncbi:DUF2817 domain-containing protein [bacterium]|nr:DUF2817 domain-containing protein [bacterium]